MKIDDSVESLVHYLVHSLTPGHVVQAVRGHYGIASDNSGCGVNYYNSNDPKSPSNRPGQVRLYSFWGRRHGGHEGVASEDEYLGYWPIRCVPMGATDAAEEIEKIRKRGQT